MLVKYLLSGSLFFMGIVAASSRAEQPSDALASASTESPLQLFVTLPVKPDHLDRFLATMRKEVKGARSENGNIAFDVYEDASRPSTLYLFEHWVSEAALASHTDQPYYKAIRGQEADDLGGSVEERNVAEISPGQPFKNGSNMDSYNVLALLKTTVSAKTKLMEIFTESAQAIRSSPGNLGFSLFQDQDRPAEFLLIERWTNMDARQASMLSSARQRFNAAQTELMAGPSRQTPLVDRSYAQD